MPRAGYTKPLPPIPKRAKDEYAEILQNLNNRNLNRLEEYFDALHELAVGIHMQEITPTGQVRRYQSAPSYEAAKYLIDRGAGKAPDRVELAPAGGFNLEQQVLEAARELELMEFGPRALPSPVLDADEAEEAPEEGEETADTLRETAADNIFAQLLRKHTQK